MASQWYSLVSQKLFLAKTLLELAEDCSSGPYEEQLTTEMKLTLKGEAAIQGSIELLLRARKLLLVLIAQAYQRQSEKPDSLGQLSELIGEETSEVISLRTLQSQADSWWNHLNQLEHAQTHPPAIHKTVSKENIIATSTDDGPDRSTKSLQKTLNAIKHFTDDLEELYCEW
jgi:hypothetical protein